MTLPQMRVVAFRQGGRRFADAALLVLLLLLGSSLRAQADDDPFAATVKVDATADSVVTAREAARIDGQRHALAALVDRLSGGGSAKLPKLDDKAITDMVASFEVANERMSAVRYVADYTFHFRPAEVRRALQKAGIAAVEEAGKTATEPTKAAAESGKEAGKRLIVIPLYQSGTTAVLWDDPNPWRDAWAQWSPAAGALRLAVPLGDAGDIAAIDADKARAGAAGALAAIARRNGGDEAIVASAALRGTADKPAGVDVTVRHYRGGEPVDSHSEALTANPGEGQQEFLRRAVAAVASDIESGWKQEAVPRYDQQGSLTAVLPITGLDDWVRARERLAALPTIRKIALVALSLQEATIEIDYLGSIDQLRASLREASLDLVRGDPLWRLARAGAPATP